MATALIFAERDATWKRLRSTCRTLPRELVIGAFPKKEDLLKSLGAVYERLAAMEWHLGLVLRPT
jgi:hypothetical protein